MLDLADEATGDFTSATTADKTADEAARDKPVILDAKQEVARTHECEYCGYDPCGCGG